MKTALKELFLAVFTFFPVFLIWAALLAGYFGLHFAENPKAIILFCTVVVSGNFLVQLYKISFLALSRIQQGKPFEIMMPGILAFIVTIAAGVVQLSPFWSK